MYPTSRKERRYTPPRRQIMYYEAGFRVLCQLKTIEDPVYRGEHIRRWEMKFESEAIKA